MFSVVLGVVPTLSILACCVHNSDIAIEAEIHQVHTGCKKQLLFEIYSLLVSVPSIIQIYNSH